MATEPADKVIGDFLPVLWNKLVALYPNSFGKEIPVGTIDRIYCSDAAVKELDWKPKYTAQNLMQMLIDKREKEGEGKEDKDQQDFDWRSELALLVGKKGYHRKE